MALGEKRGVLLKKCEGAGELIEALKRYFVFYNDERPHQSHEGEKPAEVYDCSARLALAALSRLIGTILT